MVNRLPWQIDPSMVCWESRLYVKQLKRGISVIVKSNEHVNRRVKINYYYYYYCSLPMLTTVDGYFGSLVSQWRSTSVFYHPCMRVGNVFSHVCVSVFVSVCLLGL